MTLETAIEILNKAKYAYKLELQSSMFDKERRKELRQEIQEAKYTVDNLKNKTK